MCFGSKSSPDEGAAAARPVPKHNPAVEQSATWAAAGPAQSPSHPTPCAPIHHQPADSDYAPPPGPPPGHGYAPPQQPSYDDNAAAAADAEYAYAPPAGPPPGHHDWQTAVPDTALLPPPPALFTGWDRSPASNAPEEQSVAGEEWCRQYPLQFPAMDLRGNEATRRAVAACAVSLQRSPVFRGTLEPARARHGSWAVASARQCPDACLVGFPPSYAPSLHSPAATGRPFVMYYEVQVQQAQKVQKTSEVTLAMGFTAMPYPPFRMPGWHRGSVAVHGDDGHRYVNDTWGGKTLREGFAMRAGGTYGIGMRFTPKGPGAAGGVGGVDVEVFFTVEGRRFEAWDIHEETDAEQDRPVTGLEGYHDLSIAVGVFDSVAFEVRPHPSQWLYEELKQEKLAEMAGSW